MRARVLVCEPDAHGGSSCFEQSAIVGVEYMAVDMSSIAGQILLPVGPRLLRQLIQNRVALRTSYSSYNEHETSGLRDSDQTVRPGGGTNQGPRANRRCGYPGDAIRDVSNIAQGGIEVAEHQAPELRVARRDNGKVLHTS